MKALITTLELSKDPGALTLTLTSTGPLDDAIRRRLVEMFTTSTVVEVDAVGDAAPPGSPSTPMTRRIRVTGEVRAG